MKPNMLTDMKSAQTAQKPVEYDKRGFLDYLEYFDNNKRGSLDDIYFWNKCFSSLKVIFFRWPNRRKTGRLIKRYFAKRAH